MYNLNSFTLLMKHLVSCFKKTTGQCQTICPSFAAEMVGNQFDEASEKASDDAIRLNTASQTASKVCEDVQNANAEVMEEVCKLHNANRMRTYPLKPSRPCKEGNFVLNINVHIWSLIRFR